MTPAEKIEAVLATLRATDEVPPQAEIAIRIVLGEFFSIAESLREIAGALKKEGMA